MILFADENVDGPIVQLMRRSGHEAVYVAEVDPSIADEVVLEQANEAGAVRLTADTDFGELVYRQGRIAGGVVLIRLAGLSPDAKAKVVVGALAEHGHEMLGRFTVVTPGAVRIRKL